MGVRSGRRPVRWGSASPTPRCSSIGRCGWPRRSARALMSRREVDKFVDDLLAGHKPKPFAPDEFRGGPTPPAIDLTAARRARRTPRPEFLDGAPESATRSGMSTNCGPTRPPPRGCPARGRPGCRDVTGPAGAVGVPQTGDHRCPPRPLLPGAGPSTASGWAKERPMLGFNMMISRTRKPEPVSVG